MGFLSSTTKLVTDLKKLHLMSSIIHRFTPPTCTLEISNQTSFFSRWTDSNVLKKLQFKLRFDDPRQPTSRQVTIEGNKQELLNLQTAINDYLQTQLQSSFHSAVIAEIATPNKVNHQIPYLKPQGLVHHQLFFGSLTHDSNQPQIKLSTVQLFDLVSALEAFQEKIKAQPNISQTPFRLKILPLWGGIAAVAIAAIALPTIFKPQTQPEVASSNAPTPSSTKIPELETVSPPSVQDLAQQPATTPQLIDPLSSTTRLPPPPAVDTPKPKPDIPNPEEYPLSDVARQSGLDQSPKQDNPHNPSAKSTEAGSKATQPEIVIVESNPQQITTSQPKVNSPNSSRIEKDVEDDIDSKLEISPNSTDKIEQDRIAKNSFNSLDKKTPLEEVTAYFKSKWQPPEELKQGLEYRLLLDSNGAIKKVIPLGKASRLYFSQTSIPVNGEPLITPLTNTKPLKIRLFLNPDGRVQVFQESN